MSQNTSFSVRKYRAKAGEKNKPEGKREGISSPVFFGSICVHCGGPRKKGHGQDMLQPRMRSTMNPGHEVYFPGNRVRNFFSGMLTRDL